MHARLVVVLLLCVFAVGTVRPADSQTAKLDMARLAADLTSRDAEVRAAAADRAANAGPPAAAVVPQLAAALASTDADLRMRAARALGAIGPGAAKAAPALVKAFDDRDPKVRAQAERAIGLIGVKDTSVTTGLAKHIVDEDATVRRAAIAAIRQLKPGPKVMVPLVVKALEDADPSVIMPALASLAESGPEAVPGLIEALHNDHGRYWACLVLGEIGPQAKAAVPDLAKLLSVDEPELRLQVLMTLGEIGPDAKLATDEIIAALDDKVTAVRFGAVYALAKIGAKQAVPALEKEEQNSDPFLAMLATWAVAKLQPDNKEARDKAIATIVKSLKQDNVHVRTGAAKALFELHAPPEVVGPALIEALEDPDPAVQANIYTGLASLGEAIVPRLVEGLKDPKLQAKALRILSMMGPKAKGAVPALLIAMKTADPAGKRELLFALASIGPDSASATPGIVALLSDSDEDVRVAACYALGKIGPAAKVAVPALNKNLKSDDRLLRLVSVWALLRIQPGDAKIVAMAVPLLSTAVVEGKTELARFEAASALGDIGPAARSAAPALRKALDDESPLVRSEAASALKKVGG